MTAAAVQVNLAMSSCSYTPGNVKVKLEAGNGTNSYMLTTAALRKSTQLAHFSLFKLKLCMLATTFTPFT